MFLFLDVASTWEGTSDFVCREQICSPVRPLWPSNHVLHNQQTALGKARPPRSPLQPIYQSRSTSHTFRTLPDARHINARTHTFNSVPSSPRNHFCSSFDSPHQCLDPSRQPPQHPLSSLHAIPWRNPLLFGSHRPAPHPNSSMHFSVLVLTSV